MSIVNTREKTIQTKVVYYGPGLGGKTTSLQVVHSILDPDERVKLVSLKTEQDRTLFFDFLPLDLGNLGGYKVKIQAFTVPGQVQYNLTRRYVLMGADAVVFVADSQASRIEENLEATRNLEENLEANGLDPDEIPLVLQFNKRDLSHLSSVEELQDQLNTRSSPVFESSATQRQGVFEPFVEAVRRMLQSVARRYELGQADEDVGAQAAAYLSGLATSP